MTPPRQTKDESPKHTIYCESDVRKKIVEVIVLILLNFIFKNEEKLIKKAAELDPAGKYLIYGKDWNLENVGDLMLRLVAEQSPKT